MFGSCVPRRRIAGPPSRPIPRHVLWRHRQPISSIYGWEIDKMLRNQGAKRQSSHLNHRPTSNIHHAIRIAEALRLPLSQFITINFAKTACAPKHASARFCDMRSSRVAKWLSRPRRSEARRPDNGHFGDRSGRRLHAVHWLLHVPPERLAVFRRLVKWVAMCVGAIECPSAI